jgi:cytochrome c-type biogenesis protein CcmH
MPSSASVARPAWKRVKGWPGWAALAVVVVVALAIGLTAGGSTATPEERVESISQRLACPICDGETVFESRNNESAKIRTQIRTMVDEGQLNDDEIISYFVQRNARLLIVPRSSGLDALVWALPAFVAVCAIAGLAFAFRRWSRTADTVPTDADRELVAAARLIDEP